MLVQRIFLFRRLNSARPVTTWRIPAEKVKALASSRYLYHSKGLTHSQWVWNCNGSTAKIEQMLIHSSVTIGIYSLGIDLLGRNLEFFYTICELRCKCFVYLEDVLLMSAWWLIIPTSKMSTSSLVNPSWNRILGIAYIGEIPIYRGSTPVSKRPSGRVMNKRKMKLLTDNSGCYVFSDDFHALFLSFRPWRQYTYSCAIPKAARIPCRRAGVTPVRECRLQSGKTLQCDSWSNGIIYRDYRSIGLNRYDLFCEYAICLSLARSPGLVCILTMRIVNPTFEALVCDMYAYSSCFLRETW